MQFMCVLPPGDGRVLPLFVAVPALLASRVLLAIRTRRLQQA